MIWDRHTKHFRGGKARRRKAVKEREKPLTSGKDSNRKPPIYSQTAGGQTEWTSVSMSVSSV